MGAMGAFLIALSRGGLTLGSTFEVLKETSFTAAALFSVLIGAQIFSNFINLAGLPEALIALVTAYEVEPFVVILMILGIYIILGCVFESLSSSVSGTCETVRCGSGHVSGVQCALWRMFGEMHVPATCWAITASYEYNKNCLWDRHVIIIQCAYKGKRWQNGLAM